MERHNIKELTNIDEDFVKDGTAAMYLATNPLNNRTGVLKENGCMVGVNNEDIREKLASVILNQCGVPCAEIDLFIDDAGNKYAFSYNILNNDEEHIEWGKELYYEFDKNNKEESFLNYFNKVKKEILLIPGISKVEIDSIFQRILSIVLTDCLVDHYDCKSDNMKIIKNKVTGRFMPPIAYDYGVAFHQGIQSKGPFFYLSNEEVVSYLFKFFPDEIKTVASNIKTNLSNEFLTNSFNESYLDDFNKEEIKNKLLKRKEQIVMEYDKTLEITKTDINPAASSPKSKLRLIHDYLFSRNEGKSSSIKR